MGQQSLIYAFVARGTVVLAEYTEFTGNFTTIAAQCLQKLPTSNNKFTYNCDGHTFNYLVEDGFRYLARLFTKKDPIRHCQSRSQYIGCPTAYTEFVLAIPYYFPLPFLSKG